MALEPTLRHPAIPGPRVNAMPSTSWTRIRASSRACETAVGFDSGHSHEVETTSNATYQVPLVRFDSHVRLDTPQWSVTVHEASMGANMSKAVAGCSQFVLSDDNVRKYSTVGGDNGRTSVICRCLYREDRDDILSVGLFWSPRWDLFRLECVRKASLYGGTLKPEH